MSRGALVIIINFSLPQNYIVIHEVALSFLYGLKNYIFEFVKAVLIIIMTKKLFNPTKQYCSFCWLICYIDLLLLGENAVQCKKAVQLTKCCFY